MKRTEQLAKAAISSLRPSRTDLENIDGPDAPGIRLTDVTQGSAYRAFLALQNVPERQGTIINVGRTRAALAEINGVWPSTRDVWDALRSLDLSRPVREFLWRLTHNVPKVGKYWLNISNYEHRSECQPCEVLESMDHILFECDAEGQGLIWQEAKDLWSRTGRPWPEVSLGAVIGCGLIVIRDERGKAIPGAARLLKIIISEAAFLIWKIRCERVIGNGNDPEKALSEVEISNRFRAAIQKRLKIDTMLTSKRKFKQRAIPTKILRATWEDVLFPNGGAPERWWSRPELLVSMWPPRPRGRER
ncbi:hypothetical protein EXIGLDRAFT_607892 [Exidia glandulosa HHB12029]|uniref:Reverse transcriptase zinc-binding domain-containing protein n=1 Tax=Exidia glandulosa HHB12029 TaxID=1314781 RepID=A0A165EZ26_EXIGL|nr:hypothetical protein EXIGLDRAFT_619933 [Exidia glandulosa HHB12029]KZV97543.1 hypothetical protein EXIGLDRAFT_607892 [Exidia glandulosa HHB12029]